LYSSPRINNKTCGYLDVDYLCREMNNYNDLADIRGTSIPMFNQHGTALTQEEREAIAKKKGVCVKCGMKTHDVKMFKRTPLTNDHVYDGKCIRCNSTVPPQILQQWEQKFKPSPPGVGNRVKKLKPVAHVVSSTVRHQPNPSGVSSSPAGYTHPQQVRPRQGLSPANSGSSLTNPDNTSRQPQSEGSIRSNIQTQNQSNQVFVVGSEAIFNEDYGAYSVSLEARQLFEAINTNKRQPEMLRPLLHRLRNSGDQQGQSLHDIKELMEIYTSDAKFLTVCCGAMWGVAARSDSLKAKAAETGAISTMLDALSAQSNQRDSDFVQWVFGSISCLAQSTISKQVLIGAGSIALIIESMQWYQTSAAVFEWSCRALYTMVVCYDENVSDRDISTSQNNISSICEDGGVSAILSMMKTHSSEIVSQMWAIKLLWRLQDRGANLPASKKVTEKILAEGGISVCSKILKNRSASPSLFEATAALLFNLLMISDNDQISSADCMAATIRKLTDNPEDIDLSVACCDILFFLVSNDRLEFKDSEGLKAVLGAMSANINHAPLQRSASNILWAVSYIPAFFDLSLLKESLEVLVLANEAHSNDVQFLASACGFIANVVTFPTVTSSDIPYFIPIHAWNLVSHNTVLHDQAGRALGNICCLCPKLMKKVIDAGGVKYLVKCYGSKSTKVIQSVTSALIVIARQSDDLKRALIDAGCLFACKTRIQAEKSVGLNVSMIELIHLLTESRHFFSEDIPGDMFQAIIEAVKLDLNNPQLIENTCGALRNLLLQTVSESNYFDFTGLVDTMIEILNVRSATVDIKRDVCLVLWTYIAKQRKFSAELLEKTTRTIVEVMRVHKGDENPYNSGLQTAAFGALSSITSAARDQSINLSPEDVEVIIGVAYMVMEYDRNNIDALENFLDTMLNLATISQALFIECGGAVVVIDTMVEHESIESIQERGCTILATLSALESIQVNLCIAETDGIDMLVSALAIFSANKKIQLDVCAAFSFLSVEQESRMLISSQGGLMLIVNAVKTCRDDTKFLEVACSALLNLSADVDELVILDSNIVPTVVEAMRFNPNADRFQIKALGVLQNISMKSAAAKRVIADAGGINVVLTVMKELIGSADVLDRAFTTLWSLAVLEKNQVEISRQGGIELVVNGMMANISYWNVQKQACGCLCTLSSNSHNKTRIREAGGVDAIVFAMWAHYDSEPLQREACRALSCLAVNVQTNEVMIATDGEINAIISALRLFPDSQKLQEHACVALRNFMLSADNVDLIKTNSSEVRRLMIHALNRFPEKCTDRANQVLASL
jgi:hypothetical protein